MNSPARGPVVRSIVVFCLLATVGCTSLRTVPLPGTSAAPAAVAVGERVRVTMTDGQVQEFAIRDVAADGLQGRDVRVSYADMTRLEVRRFDKRKTWILAGSLAGAVVLAVVIKAYIEATAYSRIWASSQ